MLLCIPEPSGTLLSKIPENPHILELVLVTSMKSHFMKTKYIILYCIATFCLCAQASAKPDFQMPDATVHKVEISDDQITLVVSGDCRFGLFKNSSWVDTYADHVEIVIRRPQTGKDDPELLSWEAQTKAFRDSHLESSAKATLQLMKSDIQISQGKVRKIVCLSCYL